MEHEEFTPVNFEKDDEMPYFYQEEVRPIISLLYELLWYVLTYETQSRTFYSTM